MSNARLPHSCRKQPSQPKAYLTYQSLVSGGQSTVAIATDGDFATILQNEYLWRIRLAGDNIMGLLELTRIILDCWQRLPTE